MSEEYRFKDRIKDIINGDVDYDKLRKAEKQGWIDRADTGFQLFLIFKIIAYRGSIFWNHIQQRVTSRQKKATYHVNIFSHNQNFTVKPNVNFLANG